MSNGRFRIPEPLNEPVRAYNAESMETKSVTRVIEELKSKIIDIPMFINGKEIKTNQTIDFSGPNDHKHVLAKVHQGDKSHIDLAISSALNAKEKWENFPWADRASIFLKAAELLAGPYRDYLNASTMLGQGKNIHQAEIDAACELVDFFRFNVKYADEIYEQQPYLSPTGMWNRLEHRALEGFIYAVTPFNFTSIAGNLPTAPALMGNVVVWKPAKTQAYSAYFLMKLLQEAGLPDGVINIVYGKSSEISEVIFNSHDFSGVHFTGSTDVFNSFWKIIGNNISKYKSYPRIVGETGGKDFILAHPSSDILALATAIARGAFEYQGQKCSAASRVYIPQSIADRVKLELFRQLDEMKMGPSWDFKNFINPVIDAASFDNCVSYIEHARNSSEAEIIYGGTYDNSVGYFIKPTVILAKSPKYKSICEEIFGPILTLYVYPDEQFVETCHLVNQTSPYALTGAVFSQDRYALKIANDILKHSAGNFYINDKPTGAVVGQQPFGGARASGTNDKAGSALNLLRWVSPRTIKETFVPPHHFAYPFHQ